MKEPDLGSVSDNEDFHPVDNISQLTRTVSSVNPAQWNESDLLDSDRMSDSPYNYDIEIRPEMKPDTESLSGKSRSSSSTSAASGVDDLIDWGVYQKLLGQCERQCNNSSRWNASVLPNNMLITTMDKLTEMIEKGLDISNENGVQQLQGMLQQVMYPTLRNLYNDDPGMSFEQFEKVMSCSFRFVTLFLAKLKNSLKAEDILCEFWLIMNILFNVHAKFYQRVSANSLSSIMQIVPGDLDVSRLQSVCRDVDSHHWFQALLLWFTQSNGFEIVDKFISNNLRSDTTINQLSLYFSWYTGVLPILQSTMMKKFLAPYVNEVHSRLVSFSEKDLEFEKIKGDVRESPFLALFGFCKCSIYHFPDLFASNMLEDLDCFKLRFLKGAIAESSFNTRMSALDDLYRFLKCSHNDILGCHLDIGVLELKIEEFGLVEALYKDNLHHVAYIDRVEKVMADLFDRQLLMDSVLNIIWNSQKGKHEVIQRNVQILTARLAGHFSPSIADGFFSMLQVSWITGDNKDKLNIVDLLRRVGFDLSNNSMLSRVVNFLWKQSRTEDSMENVELQSKMMEVLYDVLDEAAVDTFGKTTLLPEFIFRCVDDVCNETTPGGLILHSLKLCKKLIKSFSEKMIKPRPFNARVDIIKRIEDHVQIVFEKSFCDAIAQNITQFANALVSESPTSAFNHDENEPSYALHALIVQFEFLKFYFAEVTNEMMANPDREVSVLGEPLWVNDLWNSVMVSTYPGVQDAGFRFFTDLMNYSEHLFRRAANLQEFFETNVLSLNPSLLSVSGFHCFEAFLKKTNLALAEIQFKEEVEDSERSYWVTGSSIKGEDYLWKLIINGNDNVQSLASNLFVCLFSSPTVDQKGSQYADVIISKCMRVLSEVSEKQVNTPHEVNMKGVKVRRVLQTITELVDTNERDHRMPIRTRPPLRRSFMGKGFVIRVQFRADDMQLLYHKSPIPLHVANPRPFNVHDNMLLVDLIEKICQYIMNQGGQIHPYALSIVSKLPNGINQRYGINEWGQTLRELSFDSRTNLFAKPEKARIGSDGSNDSLFLLRSGKQQCQIKETALFSVVLSARRNNISRLISLAGESEVSEQAFSLLGSIPSLKQAPCVEQFGNLDATIGPFQAYLEEVANEKSPAHQVYALMVLNELILPANLSCSSSYVNQLLFFMAKGVRIFKHMLIKNSFSNENSQLRGLGYHFILRLLSFGLLFALQLAIIKTDSKLFKTLADTLPRHTDCCVKEVVLRMTALLHDRPNVPLVDKVFDDCSCDQSMLKEILEVAFFLLKDHTHVSIYHDSTLDDLECVHDYDEGDLMVVGGAQIFSYLCVLNHKNSHSVLVSNEWNEYVNAVIFDERRLVACWNVEIIASLVVNIGNDPECPDIFNFLLDQLFNIIDVSSSKSYWDLLYKIVENCDKSRRLPHLANRLHKCISWLEDAQKLSQDQQCSYPDDVSLTGRLRLCFIMIEQLTPHEKADIGGADSNYRLIELLVNYFLLPSSRAYAQQLDIPRSQTALEIHTASSSSMFDLHALNGIPRSSSACPIPHRCVAVCGTDDSQKAAYNVLYALCIGSEPNMRLMKQLFLEMFYKNRSLDRLIWEYQPDYSLRVAGNYVGLKNGGATCYMNSILQQIFMLPQLRNAILNVEPVVNDADPQKVEEILSSYPIKALEALQSVFAHLVGYELDSYTPAEFWNTFRMSKEMVHLNEQQDALEFYNSVVEFVDEGMTLLGGEKVCEKTFGGLFADEKICKDCPHRYSREEPFTSISIDVQSHNNLLESLKEYVLGDVLENDNAYFCEKCQKKVRAIKRLTIQRLPPILVVQLKRFEFDWDKEVPVKFNDYVEFPFDLDMKPYTAEAAARADTASENGEEIMDEGPSDCMYALRGVVVHSGSATGGHYYSFIKSSDDGKWYKFDDTEVSHYECDPNDVRTKWYGGNIRYGEDGDLLGAKKRGRCWWNAYLLFYEKVGLNEQDSPAHAGSGRASADCAAPVSAPIGVPLTIDASVSTISSRRSSTGSPVTRLHKHFSTMSLSSKMRQMPPRLEVMVRQQNTKIMHERNQYNSNYFRFIKDLTLRSVLQPPESVDIRCYQHVIELFSNFLVYTCLHASTELRTDYNERNVTIWNQLLDRLIVFKPCRLWFIANVVFKEEITRIYLLEAKEAEIRQIYAKMLHRVLSLTYDYKDTIGDLKEFNNINIQRLLNSPLRPSYADNDIIAKLMLDSIHHLISNDREKRGMEIYTVLTLFIAEPAPKPDLFSMMVRHGILQLLLRIYDTPAMQYMAPVPNGMHHYIRLLVALLRVIDLRVFLSAKMPGKPALTAPCPYIMVGSTAAVPIGEVRCSNDIHELLFTIVNYNLLTNLLNCLASGDNRLQSFMRESFLYFCWNNEVMTMRAFEVILRTIADDRHADYVYELLLTVFADIVRLEDDLSKTGTYLSFLLFNIDICSYISRSSETGLVSLIGETNKARQEHLLRATIIVLERYEKQLPYFIRVASLLPFVNEIYPIIISRYTFQDQRETIQNVSSSTVPNKHDLVSRLGNICKAVQKMAEDITSENDADECGGEMPAACTLRASLTPQSGDKRPFPDDDSPSTRRDSKKFNDGSEIYASDLPKAAEMDDAELLMATSRSAIEELKKMPMAPPPAYEEANSE